MEQFKVSSSNLGVFKLPTYCPRCVWYLLKMRYELPFQKGFPESCITSIFSKSVSCSLIWRRKVDLLGGTAGSRMANEALRSDAFHTRTSRLTSHGWYSRRGAADFGRIGQCY